jgi:hypothetical protein
VHGRVSPPSGGITVFWGVGVPTTPKMSLLALVCRRIERIFHHVRCKRRELPTLDLVIYQGAGAPRTRYFENGADAEPED